MGLRDWWSKRRQTKQKEDATTELFRLFDEGLMTGKEAPKYRETAMGLLGKGADVNARKISPLFLLRRQEDIAFAVEQLKMDPNSRDTGDETLLHVLSREPTGKNLESIKWLVEHGAKIDVQDKQGNLPLHYVSNRDVAEYYDSLGADFTKKNKDGLTPLELMKKRYEVMKSLGEKDFGFGKASDFCKALEETIPFMKGEKGISPVSTQKVPSNNAIDNALQKAKEKEM